MDVRGSVIAVSDVIPFDVMLVVLLAALLHAGWNAVLKSGGDHVNDAVLLSVGAGLIALAALPFLPLPARESWPFLGASVVVHCGYFYLVGLAYRASDLSVAYPLMRGSAPVITALFTGLVLSEPLRGGAWLGILLLSAGILWLAFDHWRATQAKARTLALGLLNAGFIAAYTITDALGVRAAGNAWSYVLWMFFLNAFPLLAIALIHDAQAFLDASKRAWRRGFVSGTFSVGSYGLVLWAMTQAPIALVAALRETSILFGMMIGGLVLQERTGHARWIAVGLITAGAAAMKVL